MAGRSSRVRVIFSDLDGTLVHFERHFRAHGARLEAVDAAAGTATFVGREGERRSCRLLPTSTMGPGVMSDRTAGLIAAIRARGVQFVYVTGARCSTLLERLPRMPTADAAFAETGGRFLTHECSTLDPEWTRLMEAVCGPANTELPALERSGDLWDWARALHAAGFAVDARSYWFGFRVSLRSGAGAKADADATADVGTDVGTDELSRLQLLIRDSMPPTLATASNLGKYDFFPAASGKGNAVRHYLERHDLSADDAVALFDDENDLPMADNVKTCFVMQATHASVADALAKNPQWRLAAREGVLACEEALSHILAHLEGAKL